MLQNLLYSPCLHFVLPIHFWMHAICPHFHNPPMFTRGILVAPAMHFHPLFSWTSPKCWPTAHSRLWNLCWADKNLCIWGPSSCGYLAWSTLSFAYPKSLSSCSFPPEPWFCLGRQCAQLNKKKPVFPNVLEMIYGWTVCAQRDVYAQGGKLSWREHLGHFICQSAVWDAHTLIWLSIFSLLLEWHKGLQQAIIS